MMSSQLGSGGFYLPVVYQKSQRYIKDKLSQAEIDYAELTRWSFPDEFMCFVLELGLLDFVDKTYPNPRNKNEIPIWFLITCQFVLHLFQTGKYNHLNYLLNAGSILTKFGFNVSTKQEIGSNHKNKYSRKTMVSADAVRKFFKDTDKNEIRDWYNKDLQRWFKNKCACDQKGLFVLDQSHLVVPDNDNYKDAVKMPVDEHGQLYANLSSLTKEQKKGLVYHKCYTLSVLLNVISSDTNHHIAGYELGAGNEDELIQAEKIVYAFCQNNPGLMQELIVDRGYIDGDFIGKLKSDFNVDTIIPLKSNMDNYKEAIALAQMKNEWEVFECKKDSCGRIILQTEVATITHMDLWPSLRHKQQVVVTRYKEWDENDNRYIERFGVLSSTGQYRSPLKIAEHYKLRTQIEERFRQLKRFWYIPITLQDASKGEFRI